MRAFVVSSVAAAAFFLSTCCVIADHGGGGGGGGHHGAAHEVHHSAPAQQAYEQPHHQEYYSPPQHYQEPSDPLTPNLYPAAVIGGLGSLGLAYFLKRIDDSYNKTLYAFEHLHHSVDHRLEHLEMMMDEDKKSNKKLDFKTKVLCKFANLFNNPTYEICNQGFDAGQVIGPTGASHSGGGHGGSIVG